MNLPTKSYWAASAALFLYAFITMDYQTSYAAMCGLGILAASVAPFYYWVSGDVPGIPVYPAYALTYTVTHGLPLVQGFSAAKISYSDDQQIEAGCVVIYFLALAGICWYQVGSRPSRPAGGYLCLPHRGMNGGLLWTLAISALILLSLKGRWLPLQGAFASTVALSSMAACTLTTALLGYNWGRKELTPEQTIGFLSLLAAHMLLQMSNLLLYGAAGLAATACIAFTIGRKRLPVFALAVMIIAFGFLQLGKAEIRHDVWHQGKISNDVDDMPRLFVQWYLYSQNAALNIKKGTSEQNKAASIVERIRLVQIMMVVQKQTSEGTPLLNGRTYWIIPRAIVPRLFNQDKIATHEGTYILCIHYRLQTREQTRTTTIGFGLLAEAYANFALPGVTFLALILGLGLGLVGRRSAGLPFLAYRSLFAFAILVQFLQTETCASVIVPSIIQTTIILLAMTKIVSEVAFDGPRQPHSVDRNSQVNLWQ